MNNKERTYTNRYTLATINNKILCEDSMTLVMKELMDVIKTNGVPTVSYDSDRHAVKFDFEGYYCNFDLYLRD